MDGKCPGLVRSVVCTSFFMARVVVVHVSSYILRADCARLQTLSALCMLSRPYAEKERRNFNQAFELFNLPNDLLPVINGEQ